MKTKRLSLLPLKLSFLLILLSLSQNVFSENEIDLWQNTGKARSLTYNFVSAYLYEDTKMVEIRTTEEAAEVRVTILNEMGQPISIDLFEESTSGCIYLENAETGTYTIKIEIEHLVYTGNFILQ